MRLSSALVAFGLVLGLHMSDRVVAAGTTYHVASTGDDSNPGTSAQPFRTLRRGVSGLRPGDTLLVGPGTYVESLSASIPSGTSWNEPVTLRAADPSNRPILRPAPGAQRVLHFMGQQYIVVDGFVLDASDISVDAVKITFGSGLPAAHHIRLANLEVKNTRDGQAILITDGDFNEIIDCEIHDNGSSDLMHGIYVATSENLIEGNRVYRNSGWGIHVYSSHGGVNRNVIRGNRSFDNARTGQRGDGIIISSGTGNVAYNNVVHGNRNGIVIWGEHGRAYHNTVVSNGTGLAVGSFGGSATGADVRNNILFGNVTNFSDGGSATAAQHNLTSDPRFVDAAVFDFHVRDGSPAIAAAPPIPDVTDDADGVSRQQASVTIGAYEFRARRSTAPPTPSSLRILP